MADNWTKQIVKNFKRKQPELLFLTMVAVLLLSLQQTDYFLPFIRLNLLLSTFIIYSLAIFVLKINQQFTVILGLVALALSFPNFLFHYVSWAERISLYAYGFFLLGILQTMITHKNNAK
ncbi:hypothetical protein HY388_02155 [Candidatus Daviesbacteria bacterium]|nr:hypothetical protein [Candidatus Daviesbacteria bacterium]